MAAQGWVRILLLSFLSLLMLAVWQLFSFFILLAVWQLFSFFILLTV